MKKVSYRWCTKGKGKVNRCQLMHSSFLSGYSLMAQVFSYSRWFFSQHVIQVQEIFSLINSLIKHYLFLPEILYESLIFSNLPRISSLLSSFSLLQNSISFKDITIGISLYRIMLEKILFEREHWNFPWVFYLRVDQE